MYLFCRKLGEITPKKRPFFMKFWILSPNMFNLKNKDRFEHEIVLKILTKSEPCCSYKIVLIKKKSVLFLVQKLCKKWRLDVNLSKTNILHVRNSRKNQSRFVFLFNNRPVAYCKHYTQRRKKSSLVPQAASL